MNLRPAQDVSTPFTPSEELLRRLVDVRRRLHRSPELSNVEFKTTALLRSELEDLGASKILDITDTGAVVDVVGRIDGPTIVIRADIDALPIEEETSLEFRSEVPGVMHACGHDMHAAMAVGAFALAREHQARLGGTLRFIFQPAEEAEPLGGRAVVSNGYLDDVSAAIALHVDPELETGVIGLRSGPSMASSDEVEIRIDGASSHAGWPQRGVDAITAAAAIVGELQKVTSRRTDPRHSVTLNLGRIEGGRAANVVPDQVTIRGTLRTLDQEARATAQELLGTVCEHTAIANGAEASVKVVRGEPVLVNDQRVIDAFAGGAADAKHMTVRWLQQPTMNSEDFSFYTERIPAAIAWLGARGSAPDPSHPLHHPQLVLDENALPLGVELLIATATRLLGDAHAGTAD